MKPSYESPPKIHQLPVHASFERSTLHLRILAFYAFLNHTIACSLISFSRKSSQY